MAQSKQPRVSEGEYARNLFLRSMERWIKQMEKLEPPSYGGSTQRLRDAWLREFWKLEDHVSGVLKSVTDIDKNRGWRLIGGRNQVNLYSQILRNANPTAWNESGVPIKGGGWRKYFSEQSLSFYTADMGAISEVLRDVPGGPLRGLWTLDPTRCELTGNMEEPIKYYPSNNKKPILFNQDDFIQEVSMPNNDETLYGLGYCAISRIAESASIMIAVYGHLQEKLLAKMPKGILLMRGITDGMWNDAMEVHMERLSAREREYYGGLTILFGDEALDAKLVALSNLPEGFELKTITDLLMFVIALNFGYDPSEFWPVQFGSLGRGTEAEVQAMKASGKGGLDFILDYQDNLQRQLPGSLHFEFEQRNEQGQILEAEVAYQWARAIKEMAKPPSNDYPPTLTRSEERQLLAKLQLIPDEWTVEEEEHMLTDTERWLDLQQVRRAIDEFPNEEIVVQNYNPLTLRTYEKVIWPIPKKTFAPPYTWRNFDYSVNISRQLYEDEENDFTITEEDVDEAIAQARVRVDDTYGDILEADIVEGEED